MTFLTAPGLLALSALSASPSEEIRGPFLQGAEKQEFLRKVEERMSGLSSLSVVFEQEKTLRIFKEKVVTRGVLLFARPDRLRWETREPFRSILVVSGNDVGKFEYLGGERRALKLGRGADVILMVMDRIRGWFRGNFDREGKHYEVDVAREPRPRVVLRPKDSAIRKSIRELDLELSTDLSTVEKVTLVEGEGDRTTMRFTERRRNLEFPEGTFSVSDPKELPPEEAPGEAPREGADPER
jgi:outer membrane lipoprotein-sorting protein